MVDIHAKSTEMNLEFIVGRDSHSSRWAKFYVFGLEDWQIRETDGEEQSNRHANYQQYVALDIPPGTIFTIFEQDGDKYGTKTSEFSICQVAPEFSSFRAQYADHRHCTGNFQPVLQGTGKTKAKRLMTWWLNYVGEGNEHNRSNAEKLAFAEHCGNYINKRGIKKLPPLELKKSEQESKAKAKAKDETAKDSQPIVDWIKIEQIILTEGTQSRKETSQKTVAEYADQMRDGLWDWERAPFPIVFQDEEDNHYPGDGHHRIMAAELAGEEKIKVELRLGTKRDALYHSTSANKHHGLLRNNADKRNQVELLLLDEEWQKLSDRSIAIHCGVSAPFVGKIRTELTQRGAIEKNSKRVDRLGRTIKTAQIGTKPKPISEIAQQPEEKSSPPSEIPPKQETQEPQSKAEEEEIAPAEITPKVSEADPNQIIPLVSFYLKASNIQEINSFESVIQKLIAEARKQKRDRSLEDAILALEFNATDWEFAKYLKEKIASNLPILNNEAHYAHKIIQKYEYEISPWHAISWQYPDALHEGGEGERKRLEIRGDRICVIFPYNPQLVGEVKAVGGGRFNGDDKHWYFPPNAAIPLAEAFPNFYWNDNFRGEIAIQRAEELKKREEIRKKAEETVDLLKSIDLDKPLNNGWSLFEHQKEGIKWLLSRNAKGLYPGGILADHMGLGKTLEALVAAKELSHRNDNCPIFVICPASLRDNWTREAEHIQIEIATFSWAKLPAPLKEKGYILIADEAHYAQSLKSKRTKGLLDLARDENCLATWLLTGTPIKNGKPINLFPLLLACEHPLAQNRSQYEKHYCNARYRDVGRRSVWDNNGAAHLDELAKETENVILRRTKSECLDLPAKIRAMHPVELQPRAKSQYSQEIDQLILDYRKREKAGKVKQGAQALVTLNILRQTGSKYKVADTISMAQELLEQNQQVVIFTEFRDSAIALHKKLGGELLLGDTPQADRQELVDRFQSGESKVFVGSIKAGGVGITLTAASNVILHDRPWTPGDAEQAEDRCHRIGQKTTVNAFWQQLGIIDEKIDSLLQQKGDRIELVLKGKRKTFKGIPKPQELAEEILASL